MPRPFTAGRFYNKLESWWNRPSRLQQAAEELVYEDASQAGIEVEVEADLLEWLEQTARRTSILHQMLRRIETSTSNRSAPVQRTSEFKGALSAKLAAEYFATLVRILLYISLQKKLESYSISESPLKDQSEEDSSIEQILLVSTNQLVERLKSAQNGIDGQQVLRHDQEGTPDARQAVTLTKNVEQALYALLNDFGKARLEELKEDSESDSDPDSDIYDEIVVRADETLYPDRVVRHLLTSPYNDDKSGNVEAQQEKGSARPTSLLLHKVISPIEAGILDMSRRANTPVRLAWLMLKVMGRLEKALCSLDSATTAQVKAELSGGYDRVEAMDCTFGRKEENTRAWAAFNVRLIKSSLMTSIYGRQERIKGGKPLRKNGGDQCERDSRRDGIGSPNMRGNNQDAFLHDAHHKIISMDDIEKAHLELLDAALICVEMAQERSYIHGMLILLVGLWDRYSEHQTALWMRLSAPKMKVTDFIDLTNVAIDMRRLLKEVLHRHRLTAGKCIWGANIRVTQYAHR